MLRGHKSVLRKHSQYIIAALRSPWDALCNYRIIYCRFNGLLMPMLSRRGFFLGGGWGYVSWKMNAVKPKTQCMIRAAVVPRCHLPAATTHNLWFVRLLLCCSTLPPPCCNNTQCMIRAAVVMLFHAAISLLQQHTVNDSCGCCYVVPRCHLPAATTRSIWFVRLLLCCSTLPPPCCNNTQCMIRVAVFMLFHATTSLLQQHTMYDSCVCCYIVPRCHLPAATTRSAWFVRLLLCCSTLPPPCCNSTQCMIRASVAMLFHAPTSLLQQHPVITISTERHTGSLQPCSIYCVFFSVPFILPGCW